MYQKLLIRFGTGDFCSNYDKMVLRVDFWHGFQIIYQKGNKESKLIRLHPPYYPFMLGSPGIGVRTAPVSGSCELFCRQALNQTYMSYIRPTLGYSSMVWDGCSEQNKTALESLQHEAARIVTGLLL